MIDFLWTIFGLFACAFIIFTIYVVFKEGADEKNRSMWNSFWNKRKELALSCSRCGKLAAPILRTGNRYRCPCGNQFAGDYHNLEIPKGTPYWQKEGDAFPYVRFGNPYYEKELDPLSDSFDPQKDYEDTRLHQDLQAVIRKEKDFAEVLEKQDGDQK